MLIQRRILNNRGVERKGYNSCVRCHLDDNNDHIDDDDDNNKNKNNNNNNHNNK